jgi:hypothetical protein
MLNALTGGAYPLDPLLAENFKDSSIRGGYPGMDSIGRLLNDAETNMENRTLIPPRPGMDDLLDQLEDSIENSPSESTHAEIPDDTFLPPRDDSQDISSGEKKGAPPMPYYLESPQRSVQSHTPPHRLGGRIGRRGGSGFTMSRTVQSGQRYCPLERAFVSVDTCEDCEYYDEDGDSENGPHCTYEDEEESRF